jgi:hypothetical protein
MPVMPSARRGAGGQIVIGSNRSTARPRVKLDYLWIANIIYLGFVLWAVVGSAIKLVAYRRGL